MLPIPRTERSVPSAVGLLDAMKRSDGFKRRALFLLCKNCSWRVALAATPPSRGRDTGPYYWSLLLLFYIIRTSPLRTRPDVLDS